MREDMQYISGVLDELEAIVQDASGVPMSKGRAVVDRSDLHVMLDELRGSLPRELARIPARGRRGEDRRPGMAGELGLGPPTRSSFSTCPLSATRGHATWTL